MSPTQVLFLATVALAFLAQSTACALLYYRGIRSRGDRAESTPADAAHLADLEARLRAVEARLARAEGGPAGASPPAMPAPTPATAAEPGRSRRVDRPRPAPADGPVLIAVPNLAAAPSAAVATEAAAEFDRRFGAIFALADAGAPPDEVARRTGYPAGQVELILGLRPPRPADPPTPTRGVADA